jgi:catechol 2,3-dioxygenase-like lactoylglutathione lyase family enzyme
MITRIAHLCFTVSDLDRSIRFYGDGLGATPMFDFRNESGRRFGVYLCLAPGAFLEVFEGDPTAPAGRGSYSHFCLETADIKGFVKELSVRGIETTPLEMGGDGTLQTWVTDPDGNRIEVQEYTPASKQGPWLAAALSTTES